MRRIGKKLDRETPITQAAYQGGRSTEKITEHVFAAKTVIERTINAKNETVYLTLLDMSKGFDSIQRKTLQNTISTDKLHIVKKMLDISIAVRCGNSDVVKRCGEKFITDTGAGQGDTA